MREKNQDFGGHNERPRCREKTQKAFFEPLVALRPETILRSREPSRLRVRMGKNAGCMQSQFLNVLSSVPARDRGGQRRMRYIDTAKRPIDGEHLERTTCKITAPPTLGPVTTITLNFWKHNFNRNRSIRASQLDGHKKQFQAQKSNGNNSWLDDQRNAPQKIRNRSSQPAPIRPPCLLLSSFTQSQPAHPTHAELG